MFATEPRRQRASRPPRPPGTSSSARPSPRRRPPSRTTCRRRGGLTDPPAAPRSASRSSTTAAPPAARADAPQGAALESAPERAAASPRGRRPWPAGLWEPHRPPPSPAQLCVRLDAGCRVPAGSPTGWRPRARPPPYGPRREPGRRTASCRSRRAAGRRRGRSQGRPSRTQRRPRVARTAARSAAPKSRHPVDRRAARATRPRRLRRPPCCDGRRTVRPQPVREAWSTGAEVARAPWEPGLDGMPGAHPRDRPVAGQHDDRAS